MELKDSGIRGIRVNKSESKGSNQRVACMKSRFWGRLVGEKMSIYPLIPKPFSEHPMVAGIG